MRNSIFILVFTLAGSNVNAQVVLESYTRLSGSLKIGNEKNDTLPLNERGYTLIMPEKQSVVKAVLVSIEDRRFIPKDTESEKLIHPLANAKGFAVLYVSTGIPVDLIFTEQSLRTIDSLLKKIFNTHKLSEKNIFFLGNMTSGHRAMKYIEYCRKGKSQLALELKGIILCESALDWVRQWYEGQKQVRDALNEIQLFEGKLVTYLFKTQFGATPEKNMEKYLDFSTYSYFDTKMRHIKYFTDLAVRAYTFAPTNYWFSANGKGIYDCNYPDMSGVINELKLAGNRKAELIVFTNPVRATVEQMEKQTNTWNLVDKTELIEWCLSHLKQ